MGVKFCNLNIRAEATKRKASVDCPPYASSELGTLPCPIDRDLVEDTILCWGADLSKVRKKLDSWVRRMERSLEKARQYAQQGSEYETWAADDVEDYQRQLDMARFRIFQYDDLLVIKGLPVINVDVDVKDHSRNFHCLTAICRVQYQTEPLHEHSAQLHCGFAYDKKLLAFGRRGGDPHFRKVMPDLVLESPWLTLQPGALVNAFESPAFWDAVRALSDLLGAPLWPITPDEPWQCVEDTKYLKIFRKA